LDSYDATQLARHACEEIATPTVSQRDRYGDSLWIPAHRDLCGISEDAGEVLVDLHLVDQAAQEVR